MGFKQVQTLDADNVIALGGRNKKTGKANPTQVEGYYLGNRLVSSPKSRDGKSPIHFFQTSKGNIGVWGKTDLDRSLSAVAVGTMVRATFTGMKPTPNGDMYKFKVEQDTDNTIEVDTVSTDTSTVSDATDDTEAYASDDSYKSNEEEEDNTEALAAAAAERAARKAAVEARLNGKGKKA